VPPLAALPLSKTALPAIQRDVPAQITITAAEAGQRLDIYLADRFSAHSRAALQRAVKSGQITVNSKTVKPGCLLRAGDIVVVFPLPSGKREGLSGGQAGKRATAPPQRIPILYEDAAVVVINKPAGLLTHAAEDPAASSVAKWFAARYPGQHIGDPGRPGVVHRLDRDTSGVMVLAKTSEVFATLKEQFKRRHVQKEYLALVLGVPGGEDGRITRPIARSRRNPNRRAVAPPLKVKAGGVQSPFAAKPAITEWRREETFQGKYALLRVMPYTGRTHQIRVHLHFIGHPIIGDPIYAFKRISPPAGIQRLMLHAEKLTLRLPSVDQGKRKVFTAPLPAEFEAILDRLRQA